MGRSWHGAVAALVVIAAATARGQQEPEHQRRWFYAMQNLQVRENADRLIGLMGRAAGAGYNGVVLADYKLSILDRVPEHYFANAAKVRAEAKRLGLEIIPTIFPMGYSNGLLAHDPNLAEGPPVVDAPFVVRGREARIEPPREPLYANGGLERAEGDRFEGMSFQDEVGRGTVADREVVHGGRTSCRIEVGAGDAENRRIVQRVKVRPWGCYRFSAWVKTAGLGDPSGFRLMALGNGRPLTFTEALVRPDQDWTRTSVVFNSLDHGEVHLYVGQWGRGRGTIWVDDIALEELGPVNVLRRPGCPVAVTSEDGTTRYEEGRDFEPLVDPKLGRVPYAGEYEFDHEAPALRLTQGSRIQDGQRLKVSWYHPILVHGSQVMACPSEPRTVELLRDQARRVRALLEPRTYFMSHDEIRVLNWCRACRDRGLTPGQILADNARSCVDILRQEAPGARVAVWSDMFDPHHNAVQGYYLVDGTLEGSWEGLDKSVLIVDWNSGKARESLRFFAERGHEQVLAGFYDVDDLSGFTRWDAAARGVPGVVGFLYTTWQAKYGLLEEYGRAMQRAR